MLIAESTVESISHHGFICHTPIRIWMGERNTHTRRQSKGSSLHFTSSWIMATSSSQQQQSTLKWACDNSSSLKADIYLSWARLNKIESSFICLAIIPRRHAKGRIVYLLPYRMVPWRSGNPIVWRKARIMAYSWMISGGQGKSFTERVRLVVVAILNLLFEQKVKCVRFDNDWCRHVGEVPSVLIFIEIWFA